MSESESNGIIAILVVLIVFYQWVLIQNAKQSERINNIYKKEAQEWKAIALKLRERLAEEEARNQEARQFLRVYADMWN